MEFEAVEAAQLEMDVAARQDATPSTPSQEGDSMPVYDVQPVAVATPRTPRRQEGDPEGTQSTKKGSRRKKCQIQDDKAVEWFER